jgi:ribosome recycling factor
MAYFLLFADIKKCYIVPADYMVHGIMVGAFAQARLHIFALIDMIDLKKEKLMDFNTLKSEAEQKTAASIEVMRRELAGLRTGRASVHLLDGVRVDAYGAEMPIDQLASVSASESQVLVISVWDAGLAGAVEKAIRESNLGLNPQTAGAVIRLNLPPLTEERRRELAKVAREYAENAHIAIRNIRQDIFNLIKKSELSEDEQKRYCADLQKAFDTRGAEIDEILKQKETDIMSV